MDERVTPHYPIWCCAEWRTGLGRDVIGDGHGGRFGELKEMAHPVRDTFYASSIMETGGTIKAF